MAEPIAAYLTLSNHGKGIPYFGIARDDGTANHGYKRLKGNIAEAGMIVEAQDVPALRDALIRLNAWDTSFFTVGCEKSVNAHGSEFWMRGYLEIAFNDAELVANAQHYFKLFFEFNRFLWTVTDKPSAVFHFDIDGAHFLDGPADGWTVTIFINTDLCQSREAAELEWSSALNLFAGFLLRAPRPPTLIPIYAPNKPYATILGETSANG